MSRSKWLPAFALATLAVLPSTAHAYSGTGRAAVEKALGHVPEHEDDLDAAIIAAEARTKSDARSADAWYTLAVLELNKPHAMSLDDRRKELARAIAIDPGFKDALDLWCDLLPGEDELRDLESALTTAPAADSAACPEATAWALARIAHLAGRADDASRAAEEAERLDPAYRGLSLWLRAMLAGERKDDEGATRLFLEAIDAIGDEPGDRTAAIIWKSSLMVASPEEILRAETSLGGDQRDFLRSFWKRRDVFPLTEVNERLGEHFRRLRTARKDYPLRTNGRAYLTTHDAFKRLSPDLPYYASDLVYDYQERMSVWLDHRGLVYVRHGQPDRTSRSSQGTRAETWLYLKYSSKPLLFHFITRSGVGEFVITLNLAQALASVAVEDDPKEVLDNSADFRDLYGTRGTMHQLFQRVAASRSRYDIEDALRQESQMMAGFAREAWYDDTNNLIDKDDLLPFAAMNANFRGHGDAVDAFIYYAIPEKELKIPGPIFEFDATIVLYTYNWAEKVATAEHHFRYERPAGKKPNKTDFLIGALELKDVPTGRYNFAFQVTERKTGKVGIAKGRLIADYFGKPWVEVSDLLLAERIEPTTARTARSIFARAGHKITPIPTRTLSRSMKAPAEVYFEVYDLKPGEDGQSHYRVEYRILQIQQEPSFAEKVLGIGMNVAGAFFPFPIFLARAGLFGLGVVAQGAEKGLETRIDERVTAPAERVSETFQLDAKKYPAGVYQVYVTVKDYVSGSVSTRTLRFAVEG